MHNAGSTSGDMDTDSLASGASTIGRKSFKSFASNFTDCSNTSFSKFIQNFHATNAYQKEMLAVLAAVTEVIRSQGGKESDTEYFATLMTGLETVESEDSLMATLSLLSMCISKVPDSVLKLKFSECSKILLELLEKYTSGEPQSILKSVIVCLGVLMRVLDLSSWSHASTLHVYNSLLPCSIHHKPKVRKAAHHAVISILKSPSAINTEGDQQTKFHPAASATAKFCLQSLKSQGKIKSCTSVLHTLVLLQDIFPFLPHNHVKSLCEVLLEMLMQNNVLLRSWSLQALHGLLVAQPSNQSLPPKTAAQLLSALYEFQPSLNDAQLLSSWILVLQEALCSLQQLDEDLCLGHVSRFFSTMVQCWQSEQIQVHPLIASALEAALVKCVSPSMERLSNQADLLEAGKAPITRIISALQGALKYQYHFAWGHVLRIWGILFRVTSGHLTNVLTRCLKSIGELRSSVNFKFTKELDYAVGEAVKSMGPCTVLAALPLKVGNGGWPIDMEKSWLLPVLRESVSGAELGFFQKFFLPLAVECHTLATAAQAQSRMAESKAAALLETQIWSLLPKFCLNPNDLLTAFKEIAKTMGQIICDRTDLSKDVLAALRNLIASTREHDEKRAEVARFAKNFLPILFETYTKNSSSTELRDLNATVMRTIESYLSIAPAPVVQGLFEKAMEKVKMPDMKKPVLDLLRLLVPCLKHEALNRIWEFIVPLIKEGQMKEQKKSYRVLQCICSSESNSVKEFISEHLHEMQDLLVESLTSASPVSKAARLSCLIHLMGKMERLEDAFLKSLVGEAILCTRAGNQQAREHAFQLLLEVGKAIQRTTGKTVTETIHCYLELLLAGLAGSPTLISATLLALAHVLFQFKDGFTEDLISLLVENTSLLMTSPSREIVGSALSFVRVILAAQAPDAVLTFIPDLVKALSSMTIDCKRHFRVKVRNLFCLMMRKYGPNAIMQLLPKDDESLHKCLRNIQKTEMRKKKKKMASANEEESGEELESSSFKAKHAESIEDILAEAVHDVDLGDSDNESKREKKKKGRKRGAETWIQERQGEIVDLLDPRTAKAVTGSNPREQCKQQAKLEFPTTTDGKLIIEDSESDSEVKPGQKRKKRVAVKADMDETPKVKAARLEDQGDSDSKDDPDTIDFDSIDKVYKPGGFGIHRPLSNKGKRKQGPVDYGKEYRSKTGRGDVKRKGRPDPFAYVPLDRQLLNKRTKTKHSGHLKSLVKAAKTGSRRGAQLKAKRKGKMKKL
ncbi:unnamed protein product [Darwinula stevensoni]|uniref:RRP12-like protein n=1 Tax=Darwinula stevensoni TaxID=69355 RepID=A0A7R8X1M8_9CRUS|nr:unnamed protein product [Darwinula stevensoni]CAG0882964.1 unnamed protein product [Darwinula stevensoni]